MALSLEEKKLLREYICSGNGFSKLTPSRLEQISNLSDEEVKSMILDFKNSKLTSIDDKILALQSKREAYV